VHQFRRRTTARRARWCLAVTLLILAGCDSGDSARTADPPLRVAPATPSGPSSAATHVATPDQRVARTGPFEKSFDGIRFSVPAGWKEVELSTAQQGFIDARFEIPTAHGSVSLTCSSNAGGIDSNVRRWVGQFQAPAGRRPVIEDFDVAGKLAKWVDLSGEFDAGPMAAANTTSQSIERMLGVAIPLAGGRDFYLKLTGSDAAVTDIRQSFREFARDARPNN
jgi:hypothetical protein